MKAKTKTNTINLRLSNREIQLLDSACRHTELNRSEYLRQCIYNRPAGVSTPAVKELAYQLSKIGQNINQIARSVNNGGMNTQLYDQSAQEISFVRTKLHQILCGYCESIMTLENGELILQENE